MICHLYLMLERNMANMGFQIKKNYVVKCNLLEAICVREISLKVLHCD